MKTSDLGGLDSLLSMVQMPSGVPVACVAINGAKNAAIFATQILGATHARVPRRHREAQAGDGRGLRADEVPRARAQPRARILLARMSGYGSEGEA